MSLILRALCGQKFYYNEKGWKASDIDIRRKMESPHRIQFRKALRAMKVLAFALDEMQNFEERNSLF